MRNEYRDPLLRSGALTVPRPFDEVPGAPDWPGGAGRATGSRPVWHVMRRHLGLIVLTLICLNAVGAFVMTKLPPRYTAEASVLIGPREAQVMDLKAVISGLSGETDVLESEIEIIRSRRLARSVVVAHKLDLDPGFNPALDPPGLRDWIAQRFHAFVEALPAVLQPARPATLPEAARDHLQTAHDPLERVTDSFLRHVTVSAKGRSRVVGIAVDAANPVLAADLANDLAQTYIKEQLQNKIDATEHAHEWLQKRVDELHNQVIEADTAVEDYRQRLGLLEGRNTSLTQEQISELGQQIITAQTQRANAEARLQTVMAALATQDGIYDLPEVQQSQIIRDLRAQESKLVQSMAGMEQNFKSGFPRVAQIRAQLTAIHERIRAEVERIAGSLRDDAQIAQVRERLLELKLAALGGRVYRGKAGEIQLHSLQHEADADRALYDRLLARAKETQVETGLQQPDAQIVSQAEPPERPSFPNPLIILPACFVASCLLTVLLVLLMENLDHGISNLDQMEETLGVTGLGLVPRLTKHMSKGLPPEAYALKAPLSIFSEALRGLYTNLLLSGDEQHPKVILFASAAPGEGKTTIVLSLARLMAASGKRVLLVDCDTRRPVLHKALGLDRSPGLVDFLRDEGDVSKVPLQQDPMSSAMLLSAGPEGAVPPGIFASQAMRTLIAGLSERFDLILLDSAPVLLVSDTRALGQLADKTVLIVRWQATRREQAAAALRQMVQARSNVAGVLLSMADPRSYVSRGESGLLNRDIRLYLAR